MKNHTFWFFTNLDATHDVGDVALFVTYGESRRYIGCSDIGLGGAAHRKNALLSWDFFEVRASQHGYTYGFALPIIHIFHGHVH